MQFWGTGNGGNDDFDFGQQGNKAIEPEHDKTNKMIRTHGEDADQPGHSESSLCAQCVAKDPRFLHAGSEDHDQTRWMPRLS